MIKMKKKLFIWLIHLREHLMDECSVTSVNKDPVSVCPGFKTLNLLWVTDFSAAVWLTIQATTIHVPNKR